LTAAEGKALLEAALDDLLVDQSRVRASLLKQRMQELSQNTFDESHLGDISFRHYLERYPTLVQVQQKGTTLMVQRSVNFIEPEELHTHYRSELKKKGLRVVPSEARLLILRDIISLLKHRPQMEWRQMVNHLGAYYLRLGQQDISKSYVNDVLRVARRAEVINVQNGGSLAKAAVSLQLEGERAFQDAVINCDLIYLQEIQNLETQLDLEQASIALYEDAGHVRYLKVILSRFSNNGRQAS